MIIIFKSQQYWVQWHAVIQVICWEDIPAGHQPKLTNFVQKFDREIIWNFCITRLLLYQAFAHNTIYIIWRAILHRLSKCYSIHNKGQSWHLTNDPSHTSEIIGIRNDAIHKPIPGHQLNILWQNAVSDLYIFDHQWVNISLGSMLERFTGWSNVDHSEIWSFVKCGFLASGCISQLVIMEIICKYCKLKIEDFSHSLGQDLRLQHVIIVDSICH